MASAEAVTVGRIVRPHGLKGDVVVESDSDFAETRFGRGARLTTAAGQVLTVAASRPLAHRWVIRFAGLDSIEAVERLRGEVLQVPVDELGPLPEGQYYLHDLLGCVVVTTEGTTVGPVVMVYTGAAQAVLGIEGLQGEVLVPVAPAICREVDLAARRIVIAAPPGLLEANLPTSGRDRAHD